MIVIAHRGASAYAPEHTFASWDLARDMGADYLEQDLQMTSDGVLVVIHDETLDRTARRDGMPVRGRVIDHTLDELRACDAGSWKDPSFSGERIRTLEEVLARYPDANFYIETKKPEEAPGMEEKLLALLSDFDLLEAARSDWRVLIQSFSEASLLKIHRVEPELPLIRLLHRGWASNGDMHARMRMISGYAVGVGPSHFDVDTRFIEAAHASCLAVHPYTVDDATEMQRLTDIGVDGMFTNVPDRLLAMRPAEEPRGHAAVRAASHANRHCRKVLRQETWGS